MYTHQWMQRATIQTDSVRWSRKERCEVWDSKHTRLRLVSPLPYKSTASRDTPPPATIAVALSAVAKWRRRLYCDRHPEEGPFSDRAKWVLDPKAVVALTTTLAVDYEQKEHFVWLIELLYNCMGYSLVNNKICGMSLFGSTWQRTRLWNTCF